MKLDVGAGHLYAGSAVTDKQGFGDRNAWLIHEQTDTARLVGVSERDVINFCSHRKRAKWLGGARSSNHRGNAPISLQRDARRHRKWRFGVGSWVDNHKGRVGRRRRGDERVGKRNPSCNRCGVPARKRHIDDARRICSSCATCLDHQRQSCWHACGRPHLVNAVAPFDPHVDVVGRRIGQPRHGDIGRVRGDRKRTFAGKN